MGNKNGGVRHDLLGVDSRWSKGELERLFRLYSGVNAYGAAGSVATRLPSGFKINKKQDFTLNSLLNDIPPQLYCYVNILIFEKQMHKMKFVEFANFLRCWIYPERLELESFIITAIAKAVMSPVLTNIERMTTKNEVLVLQHYLEFGRMLYLYIYYPSYLQIDGSQRNKSSDRSRIYLDKVPSIDPAINFLFDSQSVTGKPPSKAMVDGSGSPTVSHNLDGGECCATAFLSHPLEWFVTIGRAYQKFRDLHSTESSVNALINWFSNSMNFLTPTFTYGLRKIIFKDIPIAISRKRCEENEARRVIAPSENLGQPFFQSPSQCISEEIHFLLNHVTPSFQKATWICLYATWRDGRSLNRLTQCVLYYPGVSLVAVKTNENQVFGGCLNSPWSIVDAHYFGSLDTFLWFYEPEWNIFRTTGLGQNFVYVNNKNKYNPKGLGFGGQTGCFRLWIDEDIKTGYISEYDATYDLGLIKSEGFKKDVIQTPFVINELEIWVEDNPDALKEQKILLQRDEYFTKERRQVNPQRFFKTEFDKEYFLKNRSNPEKND